MLSRSGALRGGSRMQRRSHSLTSSGTAPGDRRRPVDPAAKPGNLPVPDPEMLQVVMEASSAEDEAPGRELADQPSDTAVASDTVVPARTTQPPVPPSRPPSAVRTAELPSWPQVLATTLRLWAQRRLARAGPRRIIAGVLGAPAPAGPRRPARDHRGRPGRHRARCGRDSGRPEQERGARAWRGR